MIKQCLYFVPRKHARAYSKCKLEAKAPNLWNSVYSQSYFRDTVHREITVLLIFVSH